MSKAKRTSFDVIIVGGGMAGASMALALAPLGLSIAVIEAHSYQASNQASFDDRCLALAWSSRQIYQAMGIWDKLAQRDGDGFEAIKKIHISDRGHLGVTRLDHQQEAVEALGYVVESRVVGDVLQHEMQHHKNITLYCPATIEQLDCQPEQVAVSVGYQTKNIPLKAKLLILADGLNSQTRASLGIQINQRSYAQTAIIANIKTQKAHQNIAYERFTDSGPLALLPLSQARCSLVWTARDDQVADIMAMSDSVFAAALQQRFGQRLGKITQVGHRTAYPLVRMSINNDTLAHQNRVALIGNAAHGVHPVAGQGFNLGLRDISALAELISADQQADPGAEQLLARYWQWRQADIKQVTQITDGLITLFSNQTKALAVLRSSGLLMTDIIAPLKHIIAHEAMGTGFLQGRLSKMAVGQSL